MTIYIYGKSGNSRFKLVSNFLFHYLHSYSNIITQLYTYNVISIFDYCVVIVVVVVVRNSPSNEGSYMDSGGYTSMISDLNNSKKFSKHFSSPAVRCPHFL